MKKTKQKVYYHFTGDTLRNGEPIPPVGKWLKHKGKLVPCESGLHASECPFDALQFAPGHMLHCVVLRGKVIPDGNPVDKVCARSRKIVATINAGKMCRAFARRVALDVIDKWDAPKIVLDYLKTGDESLREAARAAACASASASARTSDWAAAWAAAFQKYRVWFAEMVDAEFSKQTKRK